MSWRFFHCPYPRAATFQRCRQHLPWIVLVSALLHVVEANWLRWDMTFGHVQCSGLTSDHNAFSISASKSLSGQNGRLRCGEHPRIARPIPAG